VLRVTHAPNDRRPGLHLLISDGHQFGTLEGANLATGTKADGVHPLATVHGLAWTQPQITHEPEIPAIWQPLLGFPRTKGSQRSHSFANCMLLLAHPGKRVLVFMLGRFPRNSVNHTYDILHLSAAGQFYRRRESHQLTRASRGEIGRSICGEKRARRSTAPDVHFQQPAGRRRGGRRRAGCFFQLGRTGQGLLLNGNGKPGFTNKELNRW
jgi:hypothetical protein